LLDVFGNDGHGLDFIGGLGFEGFVTAQFDDDLQGEIDEGGLDDGGVNRSLADEFHALSSDQEMPSVPTMKMFSRSPAVSAAFAAPTAMASLCA
jgi:hypothetical protein